MPAVTSSHLHPVLDDLVDLIEENEIGCQDLLRALGAVADPRHRRGIRHQLQTVLALTVCAVLTGARSFVGIAEWAADAPEAMLTAVGVHRGVPCESTFRRVLERLDGDAFDRILGQWVSCRLGPPRGLRLIAVDGKSVRGAKLSGGRCPHLLAAITHDQSVVLGQVDVAVKTNEIPMLPVLLDPIDLTNVVVTADAMHAQKSHAEYIVGRGGHYLLTVKGNQPSLRAQLAGLPWNDVCAGHFDGGKAHGRIEQRTIKVVTVDAGILFPHARQAIQITRRTRKPRSKKWSTETVYAVTDLTARQAGPYQLATWIRQHWHVENKLHWVRDVTWAEDLSQIRTGNGPQVMAGVRNLVISILRLAGHTNIARALRHYARRPERPLTLLLTS
jgi:predicted transposase YbfD/YdcC/urease gamma subunit